MWRKIACWLGWHKWGMFSLWQFLEKDYRNAYQKCFYCGKEK